MKVVAIRNEWNPYWSLGIATFSYGAHRSVYVYWLGWQIHFSFNISRGGNP